MDKTIAAGDFEISLIRAGVYWWDGGAIFGVVPKVLWSRKTASDELNRVPLGLNCYLIRTGKHTILVETGAGDKLDERFRDRARLPAVTDRLPEVIASHGFDPESVDIVVNSHLHWDHCSGNTVFQGDRAVAALPRATYWAARGEWEHAHQRLLRDRVSYIPENYVPLMESGQMNLVEGDHEVVPGVWMRRAPGHTRDMMVITATSGGSTFCFLSDLDDSLRSLPAPNHRVEDPLADGRIRGSVDLRLWPRYRDRLRADRAGSENDVQSCERVIASLARQTATSETPARITAAVSPTQIPVTPHAEGKQRTYASGIPTAQ